MAMWSLSTERLYERTAEKMALSDELVPKMLGNIALLPRNGYGTNGLSFARRMTDIWALDTTESDIRPATFRCLSRCVHVASATEIHIDASIIDAEELVNLQLTSEPLQNQYTINSCNRSGLSSYTLIETAIRDVWAGRLQATRRDDYNERMFRCLELNATNEALREKFQFNQLVIRAELDFDDSEELS